jgi:flagellar biosynthesis/type III secretory pathway protein FliH
MDRLYAGSRSVAASLFDEDFDHPRAPPPPPEPEIIEPVFTGAELEATRETAWREGHEIGRSEAERSDTAISRQVLAHIGAQLDTARAEASRIAEQSAEAIAHLLLDCFATTFPALSARHGNNEVLAVIKAVLPPLRHEPKIAVRLDPVSARAISREIERLDPDQLLRVDLIPTDALAVGDVRITWRNGSAVRDTAALWQQVADILAPAGLLPSHPAVKEPAVKEPAVKEPAVKETERVE